MGHQHALGLASILESAFNDTMRRCQRAIPCDAFRWPTWVRELHDEHHAQRRGRKSYTYNVALRCDLLSLMGPDSRASGGNGWGGADRHARHIISTLQAQPACYAVGAAAYSNQFAKGRTRLFAGEHVFESRCGRSDDVAQQLARASSCTAIPSTPAACSLTKRTSKPTKWTWR